MFVILIGLFFFLILPKYNNFPTTFICQFECNILKWIYQGYPQINTEDKPFDPRDIVTTSVGNAIVVDCINHTLHVISGEVCIEVYQVVYYSIQSFTMCTLASDLPLYVLQPTHNCPQVSISVVTVTVFKYRNKIGKIFVKTI
jgi:hypothetical protein